MGQEVMVISPYYHKNRKGDNWYLANDPGHITYLKNISVRVANTDFTIGVHRGVVSKVTLVFVHNAEMFPSVYAGGSAAYVLTQLAVFAKVNSNITCHRLHWSTCVQRDIYRRW